MLTLKHNHFQPCSSSNIYCKTRLSNWCEVCMYRIHHYCYNSCVWMEATPNSRRRPLLTSAERSFVSPKNSIAVLATCLPSWTVWPASKHACQSSRFEPVSLGGCRTESDESAAGGKFCYSRLIRN